MIYKNIMYIIIFIIFINHSFNHFPINYSNNLKVRNDDSLNFSKNPTHLYQSSNVDVSAPHT